MNIKEIQEWEKSFSKRKGIAQDEETAIKIAILKLMEETGEVAKAILEKKWNEVPAEISDLIIFACRIANIAEEFHDVESLNSVLEKKMKYCEKRKYNIENKKFDKPEDKEFN